MSPSSSPTSRAKVWRSWWTCRSPSSAALAYFFRLFAKAWAASGEPGVSQIAPTPLPFNGTQAGSRFGASVTRAGDTNNDGFSDVAMAAPSYNGSQGRVLLFLGSSSGLPATAALTFDGAANAQLGAGMGPCGDIDGDGFSDVVLGAPGQLAGSGGLIVYVGATQYGGVHGTQQRRTNAQNAFDLLALQSESTSLIRFAGGANGSNSSRGTAVGRERVALE